MSIFSAFIQTNGKTDELKPVLSRLRLAGVAPRVFFKIVRALASKKGASLTSSDQFTFAFVSGYVIGRCGRPGKAGPNGVN